MKKELINFRQDLQDRQDWIEEKKNSICHGLMSQTSQLSYVPSYNTL
jgi:hypothetical protein